MADTHEFGIMDSIEKDKVYNDYEPEKYSCISINGDIIDEIFFKNSKDKIIKMETFAHSVNHPYKGFAYCGITLIPPKSLKQFLDIIVEENVKFKSKELDILIEKISHAMKEKKWLIHFGI
ncbi:hypothetical protein [Oceanirhabdus seepicola]|uniref:Uncharacterized protein n=1 Tax=Oceanirhabdus seepicola TaxID=2828781 RepID=A0A9J6NXI4_9CLOT|nr:hypothetical protein [Oceanirhabdus seepicola]MCM1988971.1 hypothetical protein [Oceanirhabdus seepicola]